MLIPATQAEGRTEQVVKVYTNAQMDLAVQFTESSSDEFTNANERVSFWLKEFAQKTKQICCDHDVHLEAFHAIMEAFQNQIKVDLSNYNWFAGIHSSPQLSFKQFIEKLELSDPIPSVQLHTSVRIRAYIPPVEPSKPGHISEAYFPIYTQ